MAGYDFLGVPQKKGKKQSGLLDYNIGNVNLMGCSGNSKQEVKRDSRRSFSQTQRKEILFQQNNKCAECKKELDPRTIEFDHMKPWASGGRTITVNGRALCKNCHGIVTHKTKLKEIDKKRKPKNENNVFGFGGTIFDQPKRSKKNNGGLFGGL